MTEIETRCLVGCEVQPWLHALADLRIRVFRDWPYLYDGDSTYEAEYLDAYARSPDSLMVLAMDGSQVIGAASGIPLADDAAHFHAPFMTRGIDIQRVFYFGESVLLPEYRGQGIGHRFFDTREAHARTLARFDHTAFCAVNRDPNDPRRPPDARSNDVFWRKRGYTPQPDMQCRLAWKEVGQARDVVNELTVWMREL